jgi:hypothetical protein
MLLSSALQESLVPASFQHLKALPRCRIYRGKQLKRMSVVWNVAPHRPVDTDRPGYKVLHRKHIRQSETLRCHQLKRVFDNLSQSVLSTCSAHFRLLNHHLNVMRIFELSHDPESYTAPKGGGGA